MSSSWRLGDERGEILRVPRIIVRSGMAGSLALVENAGPETGGDGKTLTGTFSVFDTWTEIREPGGRFMEKIQRNAFSKSIRERGTRVPLLYSHGVDPVVGSLSLGRLRSLTEDAAGAHYEAELYDGIPQLLLEGLREGGYGSSFRAQLVQERTNPRPGRSTYNPRGLPESVVSELKLLDVGPTSLPAYRTTSAQVRSARRRDRADEPKPLWYLDVDPDADPTWLLKQREESYGRSFAKN